MQNVNKQNIYLIYIDLYNRWKRAILFSKITAKWQRNVWPINFQHYSRDPTILIFFLFFLLLLFLSTNPPFSKPKQRKRYPHIRISTKVLFHGRTIDLRSYIRILFFSNFSIFTGNVPRDIYYLHGTLSSNFELYVREIDGTCNVSGKRTFISIYPILRWYRCATYSFSLIHI